MTTFTWTTAQMPAPEADRDRAVLHSSLWAAAGDALGWTTELSHGTQGVIRRIGSDRVTRPVPWRRVIGGRGGPTIALPAGTYSDDTQLRLAVSRAIRGDGSFDVEAFAKIELTVWPTYALGAGRGSKAAAANLARRSVNWFSNFFDKSGLKYVFGGGNGAAMRIQPHVWSSSGDSDALVVNVFRDAIVTHGHPHGFCGAIFHALSLAETIRTRFVAPPGDWGKYLDRCLDLPQLIEKEPQLAAFWLSEWEVRAGVSLQDAVGKFRDEGRRDIDVVQGVNGGSPSENYRRVIEKLGCLTPQYRGSGWKTALAALSLAFFFRDHTIEEALVTTVNELESDTDTIATMAAALLGVVASRTPEWPLQDNAYLAREASRLSRIARGEFQDSFSYPDLGHWNPPTRQYESVGVFGDGLAIAGLGEVKVQGEEYLSNRLVWQWCELPFGQTILPKRQAEAKARIVSSQLPGPRQKAYVKTTTRSSLAGTEQPVSKGLFGDRNAERGLVATTRGKEKDDLLNTGTVDSWTDEAIASNFDDRTLGRLLNQCIDKSQSVESAIGFAAVIAKAKLARMRRGR